MALEDAGKPADVWVGPYDQIMQECLSEDSLTSNFRPTVLMIWPRLEELWRGHPWPLADDPECYKKAAAELADVGFEAAARWQATLVFVLPSIPEMRPLGIGDACNAMGVFATATCVREFLREWLAPRASVLLVDAEEVVRSIGVAAAYNPALQAIAHIPYSEQFFYLMGERVCRLLLLSRRPARKLLVTDGDHTAAL
jgi:hypothetical protein